MAPNCLSGCVRGVRGLPELLRPRRERLGWTRAAQVQEHPISPRRAIDLATERDGMAASVPQLSCPGLISRSQSALSEEAGSMADRPTLLTTSKAVSPRSQGGKLCSPRYDALDGAEGDCPDGSLSALTTATAFEEAGSPANAQSFGCCIAGAPRSGANDSDWLWDTSLAVGAAALSGGKHVATFLGHQIYEAAVMAQPHVQSMADSAASALKSAAEDSMGKIRALGPRKSKLQRARASMALQPPQLQTPALPSLPELDAYTQMAYPAYSALPMQAGPYSAPVQGVQRGSQLVGEAWNPASAQMATCSSFASAHSYNGYVPGYSYPQQAYQNYQGYHSYAGYQPQLQASYSFGNLEAVQPSIVRQAHSFNMQEPSRQSIGRRVPLAKNRIISATG